MKKHGYVARILAGIVLLFITVLSCNVGLGEAVDTEPPVPAITYPPAASVVKGCFVLAGRCDDDLGVASVTITVKNTDTDTLFSRKSADINKNTWTASMVNELSEDGLYPDGSYSFEAVATDKAGRVSGVTSTAFRIDNTAPVIILSKPMAKGDDTPSKFGKTLTVAGDVSDDNSLAKLKMNIRPYTQDAAGNKTFGEMFSVEVTDFTGISSDNPLIVANYYNSDDVSSDASRSVYRSNYLKIYDYGKTSDFDADKTNTPDKYYYCGLELSDNAKTYVNPGDGGTGEGNTTTKYVVNSDDVYENLISDRTGLGFSAQKLREILKGNSVYGEATDADILKAWNGELPDPAPNSIPENKVVYLQRNICSSTEIDENALEKSSRFVLNPDNSPSYAISGYELTYGENANTHIESDQNFREYLSSDNLNLSIYAGKDNKKISENSVHLYIYRMGNDDTKYTQTDADAIADADPTKKKEITLSKTTDNEATTLSYSFNLSSTEFTNFIQAGEFYRFKVEAKDVDNTDVTPACSFGYGFQSYVNTEPPVVSFDSAVDQYFSGEQLKAGIEIQAKIAVTGQLYYETSNGKTDGSGTELSDAQKTENFKSRVLVKKQKSDKEETGINSDCTQTDYAVSFVKPEISGTTGVSKSTDSSGKEVYSFKLKVGGNETSVPLEPGKYKYTFYLSAKDMNAKSGAESFTFYVDNKAPEIKVNSISPTVTKDGKVYVNGNITLQGAVSDNNNIQSLNCKIYEVDFDAYKAKDSDTERNEYLGTLSPVNSAAGSTDGETVSDINAVNYSINKVIDTTKITDGKAVVVVLTAKDSVGNVSTYFTSPAFISEPYIIDQTTDNPVILGTNFVSLTNKDDVNATNGNVFDKNTKLIGSITDDDGLAEAAITLYAADGTEITETNKADYGLTQASKTLVSSSVNSGTTNVTFNDFAVPAKAGFYKIKIHAKDTTYDSAGDAYKKYRESYYGYAAGAGSAETEGVWFAVDNEIPKITETNVNSEEIQYRNTGTVVFGGLDGKGVISDDWKLAENPVTVTIKKIKDASNGDVNEALDAATFGTLTYSTDAADTESNKKWQYELNLDGTGAAAIADGTYEISFTVKDALGQESSAVKRTILKDSVLPVFGTKAYNASPAPIQGEVKPYISPVATASGYYNARTLILKGGVSDNLSGIEKVTVKVGTDSPVDVICDNNGGFVYNIAFNDESLGSATLEVKVFDKAGNSTTLTDYTNLLLDFIKPTLELKKVDGQNWNATRKQTNAQNPIVLEGIAKDLNGTAAGSGIEKIIISLGDDKFETAAKLITLENTTGSTAITESETETGTFEWKTSAADLTAARIQALGDSTNIYARVYDKAENYQDVTLFTLEKDATPPTVTINKPNSADPASSDIVVNGTITISGTANDTSGLKSVEVSYRIGESGIWAPLFTADTSNLYNWSSSVNTATAFGSIADGTYVYIRPEVTDNAGNTTNDKTLKLIVNQDSDRPVIKFTSIDLDKMTSSNYVWLKDTSELMGIVSDDDGISYFGYSTDGGTSFTEIPVESASGSWNLEFINDGSRTIYFKVVDANGKEFVSCENVKTAAEGQICAPSPKLQSENKDKVSGDVNNVCYGDITATAENSERYDSRLYLKVDVKTPDYSDLKFSSHDLMSGEAGEYSDWNADVSQLKFGGSHKKFRVSVKPSDSNGIKSVKVYLNHYEAEAKTTERGTTESVAWTDSAAHEWIINDIDISDIKVNNTADANVKGKPSLENGTEAYNGAVTFSLKITDNAEMVNEQTFTILLDNEPAELEIESPAQNEQVGTNFLIKGTTNGSDSSTSIKYILNSSETEIPAGSASWKDDSVAHEVTGGVDSWRLYVDGDTNNSDGYKHEKSLKNLFIDLYGESKNIERDSSGYIVYKAGTAYAGEKYTEILPFYFHFLITDATGNTSIKVLRLNADPQGDIPQISMAYPATGAILSGKIRAQGSAQDEEADGIVALYMQIDPTYDGTFNEAEWFGEGASPNLPDGTNISTKYTVENILARYNALSGVTAKSDSRNAIYIGNGNSWNFQLNSTGEFNAASSSTGNNKIAIRLYAVDRQGNISTKDPLKDVVIEVDSAAPKIGSNEQFYLYQFRWINAAGNSIYTNTNWPVAGTQTFTEPACVTSGSTVSAFSTTDSGVVSSITVGGIVYNRRFDSMAYTEDMWIRGVWWLSGSIEDETGISSAKIIPVVNKAEQAEYNLLTATTASSITEKTWAASGTLGYSISYKVGYATGAGSLNYTLKIEDVRVSDDVEPKKSEQSFKINYDNNAPQAKSAGDENYLINTKVVNDNGAYTIGSAAVEPAGESNFARTVVYFVRPAAKSADHNSYVFDTYLKKDVTGNKTRTSSLLFEDGLYWVRGTIASISGDTVTVDSTTAVHPNIHKGCLVKLTGSYYTLKQKSSAVFTLDANPSAELAGADIFFAIGNVIDHKTLETQGSTLITDDEGYGYYNASLLNTDDFMVEKAITSGTTTVWEGKINSLNMPDGAVEIHYVVFDKAGNYFDNFNPAFSAEDKTKYNVTGVVANNAPRLASLRIVSPFTGVDETKYYSRKLVKGVTDRTGTAVNYKSNDTTDKLIVSKNGYGKTATASTPAGTGFVTVKDDVMLYPEIIGGNGELKYSYNGGSTLVSLGQGHDDAWNESAWNTADSQNTSYVNGHIGSGSTDAAETASRYVITLGGSTVLKNITSSTIAEPTWFDFAIWDSTEGLTAGTDSLKAEIQLAMAVRYNDSEAPEVKVNPFFWDAAEEGKNSLYKGSKANGHIEIPEDLPAVFTTDGTGLMDRDAKVSGKITIRGTASDDIVLKSILVSFDGILDETEIAAFDADSKQWTVTSGYEEPEGEEAAWASGQFCSFKIIDDADDCYMDDRGHKVDWEFNIDTSYVKVSGTRVFAALDKQFAVKAKDVRGGTHSVSSPDKIKMDIVPYITDIKTTLGAKDEDHTIYGRTALGHYPVYYTRAGGNKPDVAEEGIEISGFNLNAAGKVTKTTKQIEESGFVTADNATTGAKKGEWSLTVNGVESINNLNNNNATAWVNSTDAEGNVITDASGNPVKVHKTLTVSDYADYAYNRVPNGKNNDILTDDVIFDIWQMNSQAATGYNGQVDNAVMKINPDNSKKLIGFAFSNGSEKFSMAGSVDGADYSYRQWNMTYDYMKYNSLHYDSEGKSYGFTVGGDINSGGSSDAASLMSDRWGTVGNGPGSNLGDNNHLRVDSMGQRNLKSGGTDLYQNKDKVHAPSFATFATDSGMALYMANYDEMNQQIKFRAGINPNKAGFGTFTNLDTEGSGYSTCETYAKSITKCQIVADSDAPGSTLGSCENYVSIGVVNDSAASSVGVVVMVWYDGNGLKYAYNTTPLGATQNNAGARKGINKDGWSDVTALLSGAGEYCKLVVDSQNGIHIAAYDSVNGGQLKYVYIADYKQPGQALKCTVDSYMDFGEHLTIDVARESATGAQIPYISYWDSVLEKPRLAYLADPATFYAASTTKKVRNGATDGKYTGTWEITVVPTANTVSFGEMNVGVWKTSGGVITDSKVGGVSKYADSKKSTSVDGGFCYGNGSSNPVVGYVINFASYIETAQKKY